MSDRKESIQHYNTIDGIPLKPWRISEDENELISANGQVIDDLSSSFITIAKHIVKCVNEHDNLAEEVEILKQEITQHIKWNEEHTKARVELSEEIERLKKENEGLSESVRILSDEYTRRLNAEARMTGLEQRLFELNQELEELKEYKTMYEGLCK